MDMDFWARVKARIKAENTTQGWIAGKIGVQGDSFRRWMSKRIMPGADAVATMAKLLDTTVEELVEGDSGRAYVLDWAVRQGARLGLPPRIKAVVDDLTEMSADCFAVVSSMIRSAAEVERAKGLMAAEPRAPEYKAQ